MDPWIYDNQTANVLPDSGLCFLDAQNKLVACSERLPPLHACGEKKKLTIEQTTLGIVQLHKASRPAVFSNLHCHWATVVGIRICKQVRSWVAGPNPKETQDRKENLAGATQQKKIGPHSWLSHFQYKAMLFTHVPFIEGFQW
jgi:hypothetical protein